MASEYSFDIVSKVDMHEVDDSVNAAMKEIANRYDFRGSNSTVELDEKNNELKLSSSDEYKIKSLYDIILTRFSKRGIPLKNLNPQKIESSLGASVKQTVKIQQGIPTEKAKEIVKVIKDSKFKVTTSIQGEQLRIVSKSKDILQTVISFLKEKDFGFDIQFVNYR